jgi:hypothetical protein
MVRNKWMQCVLLIVALKLVTGAPLLAQGRGGGPGGGGGGKGGGGNKDGEPTVSHTAMQDTPVKLGTSGGNINDIANGYCSSGTLGALLAAGNKEYILSNSHVFAGDIASGGNGRTSQIGDDISQPGLVDIGCDYSEGVTAHWVADLSTFSSLTGPSPTVDAAVAEIVPGTVSAEILEIGFINPSVVPLTGALLGQSVQKSARTTGRTSSKIEGLYATITVNYQDEVAGNPFTVTFDNQLIMANRGNKFLDAGDSGGLMVENDADPRPIGLLFAGSKLAAIANPIEDVLSYLDGALGLSPNSLAFVGGAGASATALAQPTAPGATSVARAAEVKAANAGRLENVPGSVGHAVGLQNGAPVIKVLVETITPEARQAVPAQIDGVTVVLEAVGRIVAF